MLWCLNRLEIGHKVRNPRRDLSLVPFPFRVLPDLFTPYRHLARAVGDNVGAAVDETGYLIFGKWISVPM